MDEISRCTHLQLLHSYNIYVSSLGPQSSGLRHVIYTCDNFVHGIITVRDVKEPEMNFLGFGIWTESPLSAPWAPK